MDLVPRGVITRDTVDRLGHAHRTRRESTRHPYPRARFATRRTVLRRDTSSSGINRCRFKESDATHGRADPFATLHEVWTSRVNRNEPLQPAHHGPQTRRTHLRAPLDLCTHFSGLAVTRAPRITTLALLRLSPAATLESLQHLALAQTQASFRSARCLSHRSSGPAASVGSSRI